jgi:hypothetical protein
VAYLGMCERLRYAPSSSSPSSSEVVECRSQNSPKDKHRPIDPEDDPEVPRKLL